MGGLIKHNLLPETKEEYIMARRVYEFNRYLKAICKFNTTYYRLDERAINFLDEIGCTDLISQENNVFYLEAKLWDKKIYQPYMDIFRTWIAQDKDTILNKLNESIFLEDWSKYAKGTISSWEMEVLCFYYHDHELIDLDNQKYGFSDFFSLPEDPVVEKTFVKAGKDIHIFKLHKICGTCIAKNKTKSTVTILTTTGVVEVKFRKEYFTLFDKQISIK
jgi:DNA polymerase-3 subunit alpha